MGRSKRLRREQLERERMERVGRGEVSPTAPTKSKPFPWVRCEKCRHIMPIYMVDEHLAKCQPNGAVCGKCKQRIKTNFGEHLLQCDGKPKEVIGLGLIEEQ